LFRLGFCAAMNVSWLFPFWDSGTVSRSSSATEIAFALIFFVNGEWRKLHNAELYVLYCSPIIFRVKKSRRMRWAGYVTRMSDRRDVFTILVGEFERKRPLVRSRLKATLILRRIFRKWYEKICPGSYWLRLGKGGGYLWMR